MDDSQADDVRAAQNQAAQNQAAQVQADQVQADQVQADQDHAARERATFPMSAASILRARTLGSDYRHLAEVLQPGWSVLDVGCGSGAMTAGIAQAVAPAAVTGADINLSLLDDARREYAHVPNLSFEHQDIYALKLARRYDVVVAARVLQWLANPYLAVEQLTQALNPGGRLFVLDYNHLKAELTPPPPPSMVHFRSRYLAWRQGAGMNNELADALANLLIRAGLQDVQVVAHHETTRGGDHDFARRIRLWGEVAATRGHQVVAAGYLTEQERQAAVDDFGQWAQGQAQKQTFYLLSATGTKPG